MKTLLAIIVSLFLATLLLPADDGPPKLPVETQQQIEMRHGDRAKINIGRAERSEQARREALTVKPEPKPAPVVAPQPYEHPEARRVRLQVEANKLHPVKPAPMTANPSRPAITTPKASGEPPNKRMKPKAQSAAHEIP